MEIEEPIQQLLKSTGWSCEDLLTKLQQYKSRQDNSKCDGILSETNHKRKEVAEECDVESSEEINGKTTNSDTTKVQHLEDKSSIEEKIIDKSDIVTNSISVNEEFSDTDEEEVEVKATNSSIIDEIIDDISAENIEPGAKNIFDCQSNVTKEDDTTEVTEVRVIEVNSDDEDDCFEEEVSQKAPITVKLLDTSGVEYLETYPRKNTSTLAKSSYRDEVKNSNEDFESADNEANDDKETPLDDHISNLKSDEEITDNVAEVKQDEIDHRKNDLIKEAKFQYPSVDTYNITTKICDETENSEDLRNNLKLQLNSLRTRKKGHFLEDLRTTVTSTKGNNNNNTVIRTINERDLNISEDSDPENVSKGNSVNEEFNIDNRAANDLYTQTNEFGLVILNVQGGIDIDSVENKAEELNIPEDSLYENSSNAIDSMLETGAESIDSNIVHFENNADICKEEIDRKGVFDEIRKIIRKQKDSSKKNKYFSKINRLEKDIDNLKPQSSTVSQACEKTINNCDNTSVSADNSLSSFTTEDNTQMSDKKSPFVSNTLDEFLTGDSKLNISYKVPKSGAEDGLTDSYHEDPVSPLVIKKIVKADADESFKPKKSDIKIIKAKTVAQKRKILERQRLKDLKKSHIETAATKNENIKLGTKSSEESIINNNKKNSFILVDNRKIWVKSTIAKTCIAKFSTEKLSVTANTDSNTNANNNSIRSNMKEKKISLLHDMQKKYRQQIKYRPGPLCRKPTLQVSGQDNWITEMKKLPRIFLEVAPNIGKPLPPDILSRLPKYDGKLTEIQVEFALSMLKVKDTPASGHGTFKFPLSYHNNQEHILVRKRKISKTCSVRKTYKEQKSVDSIVADIVEDLVRYVEIKEIAPTLIMEEERTCDKTDEMFSKMPVISENISSIFKKPQKKRSRIDLELSRLNCKVVNVEVEENLTEELCNKPYCQLGCVCKSLKCDRNLIYHCQRVECMLDCTCPKEKSVIYDKLTLPAGTDLLSSDTVNRIEDEAKKDLAKVEREFTQTVIHTSDKTIVVGLGGRNKTRRTTKAPKKYSDYVEHFESFKVEQNPRDVDKRDFFQKCFVKLERLHLPGVIPLCLTHNSYNCQCGRGRSSFTSSPVPITAKTEEILSNTVSEAKAEVMKVTKNKKHPSPKRNIKKRIEKKDAKEMKEVKVNEKPENILYLSDTPSSSIEADSNNEIVLNKGRPIRSIKKVKLKEDFSYSDEVAFYNMDCARVRPVSSKFHRKNLSRSKNLLQRNDFINNITEADIFKARIADGNPMFEVDLLKNQLISEYKRKQMACSLIVENSYTHKRKQTLEVRNEDANTKSTFNQDLAMQRRKKGSYLTKKGTTVEPVFDGEIIIDSRNMELLRKMGPRTVAEGYARLLPWKALIESFKRGTIKIWCMVDQPSRLLINKSDKLPPKNYVNIRQTNQTSEVVLWILRNKLPLEYHEDNVSFILKQTKDNYEICGLCTKNFTEDGGTLSKALEEEQARTETRGTEDEPFFKKTLPFKHRDLHGEQQLLYLIKEKFKLQELIEENLAGVGETSVDKNKLYMWAALPEIYKVCKWRMIFLNSDFTYLYFTTLKYSIKYTDLLSAGLMAKDENCTITLKNQLIQEYYDHSAFGIYFDPHYQDRLFIGPYFKQFNGDDIETLRYINKALVCTESFNKMQGKMDYKCGHWLIERPYGSSRRRQDIEPTIDLTNDSDAGSPFTCGKRKSETEANLDFKRPHYSPKNYGKEVFIMHNNEKVQVIDGEPRKPEDFNRYIITNIPHFGYLGAIQHDISNEIDVSWPFENKLLRFPSVASATEFLQERLSSLLQPIPQTFKISVIVLTSIDLQNAQPINASILSGHYICGEFGCYNVKTVTKKFCIEKLHMTKDELLVIFAKRAQAFVRKKIEDLAALLSIQKYDLGRYDIVKILNMAEKEIQEQRQLEKRNASEKNILQLRKRELALKVFSMISVLPEEQRSNENINFRRILSGNSVTAPRSITEPIEIPDSDEEDKSDDNKNAALDSQSQSIPEVQADSQSFPEVSTPEMQASSISENTSKDVDRSVLVSVPVSPMPQSKVRSELPRVSVLKDTNISTKVAETATVPFQPMKQFRLKSVLKPTLNLLPPSPVSKTSDPTKESVLSKTEAIPAGCKNASAPQFLQGVKIVKTNTGKLVLVSDREKKPITLTNTSKGTKVVIKNSRILSIKSLDGHNTEAGRNLNKSDTESLSSDSGSPDGKNTLIKLTTYTKDKPHLGNSSNDGTKIRCKSFSSDSGSPDGKNTLIKLTTDTKDKPHLGNSSNDGTKIRCKNLSLLLNNDSQKTTNKNLTFTDRRTYSRLSVTETKSNETPDTPEGYNNTLDIKIRVIPPIVKENTDPTNLSINKNDYTESNIDKREGQERSNQSSVIKKIIIKSATNTQTSIDKRNTDISITENDDTKIEFVDKIDDQRNVNVSVTNTVLNETSSPSISKQIDGEPNEKDRNLTEKIGDLSKTISDDDTKNIVTSDTTDFNTENVDIKINSTDKTDDELHKNTSNNQVKSCEGLSNNCNPDS